MIDKYKKKHYNYVTHTFRRSLRMKKNRETRCKKIAQYIVKKGCTVREAAEVLGISKSTVNTDITEKISKIDPKLAEQVKEVLCFNKMEASMRGGLMTMLKYSNVTK